MKMFFLILLFGKEVLLTSAPVSITNEWFVLELEDKISALNSGATINVQLSPEGPIIKEIKGSEAPFEKLYELIPYETIEAVLIDTNNNEAIFSNGSFSISDGEFKRQDSVRIKLMHKTGELLNRKFKTLKIRTKIPLDNVHIAWKNYSK